MRKRERIMHVDDFVAPREDPLVHPGKRPPFSYLLDEDGSIYPISFSSTNISSAFITPSGKRTSVNNYLRRRNVATLSERIPVLAYGTNPCPAQLEFKFRDLPSIIVPVLKGHIFGWDTIYKFLCEAGYAYAQLIPSEKTVVEGWLTLLDKSQYLSMNESEGVSKPQQHYRVGIFSDFYLDASGSTTVDCLFYVANTKVFLSPELFGLRNTPVAIAEILATGRKFPALTQNEILKHCTEVFKLNKKIPNMENLLSSFSGSLGIKLAKYLNKNFKLKNSSKPFDKNYKKIVETIYILAENNHCYELSVSDMPKVSGRILDDPSSPPEGLFIRLYE